MDELNEHHDDLFWHALNYRTASSYDAQAMWMELEACVERKQARLKLLLANAVNQADDWFDECRGAGTIKDDPLIDKARLICLQDSQTQLNNTD